ncbi:LPS-assembly protein LptD [Bartonella sp. LJL80]
MRQLKSGMTIAKSLKALTISTALGCVFGLGLIDFVSAQELGVLSASHETNPNARMLLSADELVYDRDANTVTAQGNVQIEYDGNRIVARKVTYNQQTGRVMAEGDVEIVQPDGSKIYSDKIDMTEDLGEGFVNSLRAETADNTRFAAESAERSGGQMTVFNNGAYTACEPCYYKPDSEVLWQVKAKKIIWNGATKTMRFEDSHFEIFGVPVAWFPVFEMPDPTVKRKSGVLTPGFSYSNDMGLGVRNSYFWNLAPNYDFTLSATGFTNQGLLTEGEWRHRLETGTYNIRFAHIYQVNPGDFDHDSIDSQNDNRYMVSTKGDFEINSSWKYGWDILAQSDRNFSRTYDLEGYKNDVFRSQIYLTGLAGRNYFDMRFYHFEVQDSMLKDNPSERYTRQPWVLPRIDYSFIPDESVYGGEFTFHANMQSIYRDRSDFAFADWQGNPLDTARLAGMAGTSFRLTTDVEWKRSFITQGGLVLTPILALRGDGIATDAHGSYGGYTTTGSYSNVDIASDAFRGMATAGLELRYPLLFTAGNSTHILEPMVQLFVRNNEQYAGRLPNEDAQSFVFDATTLFQRDKFSGYDRVEGGSRANVGLRYSGNFNNGWSLYALAGQSFQIGGKNSYQAKDFVSVGSDSGLETARSDYVAMIGASNESGFAIASRGRFDEETGAIRRGEMEISQNWSRVWASTQYAYIQSQPDYGYAQDRQEVSVQGGFKFADYWSISANTSYDLVSDTFVKAGTGLNYLDECFGFMLGYQQTRNPWENEPSHKFGFMLSFRTIADIGQAM